jgi:hypothetical protein
MSQLATIDAKLSVALWAGVPEVIGGNPPAVGNLARSRAFGLRAMVR